MIDVDTTRSSTVVSCSSCPDWSRLADDNAQGWRVAAEHEQSVHPGAYAARKALDMVRRRRT